VKTEVVAPVYGRNLLICDPVCVLPFGHAMPALNHFRRQLSPHFKKVVCVASNQFSSKLAKDNSFECHFTYLYNHYIKVMGRAQFERGLRELVDFSHADPYEEIATNDATALLDNHGATKDDVIYLPGGDFYGILGFINACLKRPLEKRPKLFIRLIAVLETATQFYNDPLSVLCARIGAAFKSDLRIYLSAETPAYADKLSRLTGMITYVTPYPETSELFPLPESTEFHVACVGSARLDKGFQHIHQIMRETSSLNISRKVRLTTQMMPVNGSEAWDSYTCRLYATPGIRLMEAALSSEDITALYHSCDLVLLPYAPDVYYDRGSAVLMEAASVGRPCITLKGTAFAMQVEYYGLGKVVDNLSDIPEAIKYYAEMSKKELNLRIKQSRTRFFLDIESSYKVWFSS